MQWDISKRLQALCDDIPALLNIDLKQWPSLDPERIVTVMINEVVPAASTDDFYSDAATSSYAQSVQSLFAAAGLPGETSQTLLSRGIYLTNAVKTAKTGYTLDNETILLHSWLLEQELACFPNLKTIMLMGDVAKKAFNFISKRHDGKNAIPTGSTYKLREACFERNGVKLMPSYIMTSANLQLEKSKTGLIVQDIRRMLKHIGVPVSDPSY